MQDQEPLFKFYNKFLNRFTLEQEDNYHSIYQEVIAGAKMKGANLWLLIAATIIACVGLVNNSISAVIGAMLISPLMGPIVAFGFGLACQDIILIKTVIANWVKLIVISLSISILFFTISPYDFLTDQIKSFTQATIYDILLAFFGGIAGMVGVIKSDGAKILSGVAVATSCVPPLAVCGYGILELDWQIALGGLYYYLINCSFVALGTYLTAIYLDLPKKTQSNTKLYFWSLWLTNAIFLVPAGLIMYQSISKYKDQIAIENLSKQYFPNELVLKSEIDYENKVFHLSTLESKGMQNRIAKFKLGLRSKSLDKYTLDIHVSEETNPNNNKQLIKLLEKRIEQLEKSK